MLQWGYALRALLGLALIAGLLVTVAPKARAVEKLFTTDCSKTHTTDVTLSPGDTLKIQGKTGTTYYSPSYSVDTCTWVGTDFTTAATGQTVIRYGGATTPNVADGTSLSFSSTRYVLFTPTAPNPSGQPYKISFWTSYPLQQPGVHTFSITVAPAEPPKEFTTTQKPTIDDTTPKVGDTLTAAVADWDPVATMTYAWFAGDTEIGTEKTYTVKPGDVGKTLTVKATGTLDTYKTTTVASDPTSAVASISFTTTTDPTISGDAVVGKTLTASISGWSPTPTKTVWAWYANNQPIAGESGATYTIPVGYRGQQITVKATGSALGYLDAETTSSPTSAVTLPTGFKVTYLANASGTTGSVPVDAGSYTMLDEATVLGEGNLDRTGYTFAGWDTKADGTGQTYAVGSQLTIGSANVTLYARWTANTYTVTFDSAGGSSVPDGTFSTGGSLTLPAAPTPGAEDVGRKFLGWFKDAALTQSAGAAGASFSPGVMENLTLYGGWADYTATFRRWDSASWQYACDVPTVNFKWGQQLTLPDKPAGCDSIRLDGWYSDSAKTKWIGAPGGTYTPTAADQIIYAAWTQRYVTWFMRYGTFPPTDSEWNVKDATVTLPTPLVHASGGGVFVWWRDNTAAGKPGAAPGDYAVTAPFTQRAEPVTLLAVYRYTLSYDLAGGTGGPAATSELGSYSQTLTVNVGAEKPTKPGYTFAGWLHPGGFTVTDNANRLLNLNFTYNGVKYGDVKLTAVWTPNTYTVTYDSTGGSSVPDGSFTTGGTLTVAAAPTRANYTFAGWWDAEVGGTQRSGTYSPSNTGDFTLYARWNADAAQIPVKDPSHQPVELSALLGATAAFRVPFLPPTDGGVLSYRWFLDGQPVAGANGETLTIGQVARTDAGSYTVEVTNTLPTGEAASATFAAGTLTIPTATPVTAAVLPPSPDLAVGDQVTLVLVVSSTPGSLAHQWQRSTAGGAWADLPGATGTEYGIQALLAADDGTSYRVVVTVSEPGKLDTTVTTAAVTLSVGPGRTTPADPEQGDQPPGEASLIEDGKPGGELTITPTEDQSGLVLSGEDFQLSIAASDTGGSPLQLDTSGNLVLQAGGQIHVSGTGFAPLSAASLYVRSTPRLIDDLPVDAGGSFDATRPFPADLVGNHTVQLAGLTPAGGLRTVSLGVTVKRPPRKPGEPGSANPDFALVRVPFERQPAQPVDVTPDPDVPAKPGTQQPPPADKAAAPELDLNALVASSWVWLAGFVTVLSAAAFWLFLLARRRRNREEE